MLTAGGGLWFAAAHAPAGRSMPADLETGYRFQALILRVAEKFGCADYDNTAGADNSASLPVDPHNLDMIRRAVNEGYDLFLRHDPNWSFLEVGHSVTFAPAGDGPDSVDGDASRYRLPNYITSQPKGDWRFEGDSSPYATIPSVAWRIVDTKRAVSGTTAGIPELAAFHSFETKDGLGSRGTGGEVVFWPTPSDVYTVHADFRVLAHRLTDNAERHIAGREHDHAIIAGALWYLNQQDDDVSKRQACLDEFNRLLGESVLLDRKRRPARRGMLRTFDDRGPAATTRQSAGRMGEMQFGGVAI